MFQFIRRVSGSLFPRPDRPWRDDATSHAPTIGRKRRYSVTEQGVDDSPSTAKRTKNEPVKPDAKSDSASEGESPKGDAVPPVEGQEVKEVTNGVKEVDLEDRDKVEDPSSIRPEGVPLPVSPSGSTEPESVSPEPAKLDAGEETKDEEHADDTGSVASSAPEDDAEEGTEGGGRSEAEAAAAKSDAMADRTAPAQEVIIATVESGLHDSGPETLEVKA